MSAPHLLILDGNNLIHRAFYALPPFTSANGLTTNAVHGFLSMLLRLYKERYPDYLVVAFDKTKATKRIAQYAEYKAQRKETPELLRPQFEYTKEILRALNVPLLEADGYEADDIIATVARRAAAEGIDVEIYSGDKDTLQLIAPGIKIFVPRKGISEVDEYDEARLYEVYQLLPEQIPDLKGLMGDSSDNIPGVPGVGEKTALKLLWQYRTLENVLDHAAEVSGKKLSSCLQEYADQARLSKQLATMIDEVPIAYTFEQLKYRPPEPEQALAALSKYNLNMIKKSYTQILNPVREEILPEIDVFGEEFSAASETDSLESKTPPKPKEAQETRAAKETRREDPRPGITDGLPPGSSVETWEPISPAEAFPLLAAWPSSKTIALSYRCEGAAVHQSLWSQLGLSDGTFCVTIDRSQCGAGQLAALQAFLAEPQIPKVVADGKSLDYILGNDGWVLGGVSLDLSLAAYLLNANLGNFRASNLLQGKTDGLLAYDVGREAALLGALADSYWRELEILGLKPLLVTLEQPLARLLNQMERRGIAVDVSILEKTGTELEARIASLESEIFAMAGTEFNINSPQQLGKVLFESLGLPPIKKNKTGYSTDAETLEELRPSHLIVGKVLLYRQLGKLNSTYVKGLLQQTVEGKIHTTFQQTVTATGRLSSVEPNLQNIPIRLEEGRRLRKVFTPTQPGWKLFAADYSQIELRILAHYSDDELLCRSFQQKEDVHTRTASEVFGVPMNAVSPEMRRRAKAVNFGLMYGLTDFGLARDLGIPRREAKYYIEQYFARYLGVKKYLEEVVRTAQETGEVRTLFNRLRRIPEFKHPSRTIRQFGERIAKNTPIQGTAADILKLAMLQVADRLGGLQAAMLLQVHDELLFEVAPADLEPLAHLVKKVMENAYRLSVPLVVDCAVGDNWYDMEEYNA